MLHVSSKFDKITDILREDPSTFMTISRSVLLGMKKFQTEVVRGNQNTYEQQLFSENHAVYEIKWRNIVERGRPWMAIWRMCIACWITKATDTRSQCVIHVLIAFLLLQWLHECPSILPYTHITLSCFIIVPCMHGSSNKQCFIRFSC